MKTRWRLAVLLGCLAIVRPALAVLPVRHSRRGRPRRRRGSSRIDAVVDRSIAAKQFPGAVVLVGRDGRVAFARAYGHRALVPTTEPMTRDTVFDMASLTKPVATATAVDDPARARQDPARRLARASPARVRQPTARGRSRSSMLLRHRSGLIADNPLRDYADGPAKAWERLAELGLESPPGERFRYSDVGFLVLGRLVERVSRRAARPIRAAEHLRTARHGRHAASCPRPTKLGRIAPTERADGKMLRGVVHDPRSRALGGVAGHAGLFGTADDLAVFAQMLLDGGQGRDGRRVLSPLTVRAMIDPADTPPDERARPRLGHRDVLQRPSRARCSARGASATPASPARASGSTPRPDVRHHPDQPAPPRRHAATRAGLRAEVATLVASAITDVPIVRMERSAAPRPAPGPPATRPVDCGIDVLASRRLPGAQGQARRPGHQPHGADRSRRVDDRRPVQGARRQARRPVQPRARHPRPVDADGRRQQGRDDRPADLQPLRQDPQADAREPEGRRRPRLRHPGHRGPVLHLHQHAGPGPRGGEGGRHRRSSCSTGPTRSAGWRSPGRSATRSSRRSSPTTPCRSGTG